MDINHLREFVVLAKTENFLEAAEQLFISQSTLSKHIKNIEKELGVTLFARTTRKVELSEQGEILLPHAKRIVQIQRAYTGELIASLEQDQSCLSVGAIPALAQYAITDVLHAYKKRGGDAGFSVTQATTQELFGMLRDGACELVFVREREQVADDCERIPYAQDRMVAVLPAAHPLAGAPGIPIGQLRDEELLLVAQRNALFELCRDACRRSGFEPRIAYTDHRLENLVEFAAKGMGVALLMDKLALYLDNPAVSVVPIEPALTTRINLCYLRDGKLSEAARLFIECAEQVARSLAP